MKQNKTNQSKSHKLGILNLCVSDFSNIGTIWDLIHMPLIREQALFSITPLHPPQSESKTVHLPESQPLIRGMMFDSVILVSDMWQSCTISTQISRWLKQQYLAGAHILIIGRACEALANSDLLLGRQVACHWSYHENFKATLTEVNWSNQLFCQDQRLLTCPGGASSIDMLLQWLTNLGHSSLAAEASEWFLNERIRSMDTQQRVPLQTRLGNSQPKLTEAVTLMEANLEEPLSSDDLGNLIGLSRRHLERLFKRHLNQAPSKFYLHLRLEKARSLIRDTDLSIVEVSMMCGFSSASHFSTSYRSHFGLTPRHERGRSTSVESAPSLTRAMAIQTRLD